MLAAWASATAITIRRNISSSALWSGCEAWHAGRMDLLPFLPRRYAPDLTAEIAHRFLCTGRTIDSITCRAGLGKSKTRGRFRGSSEWHNAAAQQVKREPCAQTAHALFRCQGSRSAEPVAAQSGLSVYRVRSDYRCFSGISTKSPLSRRAPSAELCRLYTASTML